MAAPRLPRGAAGRGDGAPEARPGPAAEARPPRSMRRAYVALGALYLVQGIPYGLQSGLLPVYLRSAGLSLSRVGLAKALYLPWALKPLWAPLVDRYRGGRAWLLLTTAGLALACLACAPLRPEAGFPPVAAALLLMNLLASVQDIAADRAAVRLLGPAEVGYGNALQVAAYKLGSVLAGGALLAALQHLGWGGLFVCLAAAYTTAAAVAWSADLGADPPRDGRPPERPANPWRILPEILRVPGTPWIAGFVLIYKLGEQGSVSMFPLFLLEHDFSAQKLGVWNGMVAMIFSIAGSSLGGHLLAKQRRPLPMLKSLLVLRVCSLVFQILLMVTYKDKELLSEVAAVGSICFQHLVAGWITTLTFSMMMCCTQQAREGIQATHYSCLATLEVLGKLAFSTVAGSLVDWLGFPRAFGVFLGLSLASVAYVLLTGE